MLADGSFILVSAYVTVLAAEGISPSLLEFRLPNWPNGSEWTAANRTLATLLIGKSYVVAEHFQERRIDR